MFGFSFTAVPPHTYVYIRRRHELTYLLSAGPFSQASWCSTTASGGQLNAILGGLYLHFQVGSDIDMAARTGVCGGEGVGFEGENEGIDVVGFAGFQGQPGRCRCLGMSSLDPRGFL